MEKIPWYQSAILRQQIIALLLAVLSLTGLGAKLGEQFDIEKIVTAVFALAAVLIPALTIFTRLFKASPPITEVSAVKEVEVQAKLAAAAPPAPPPPTQAGYAVKGMLGFVLALAVPTAVLLAIPACETLGVPQAKTFNERTAAAYTTITSVREATATWLTAELAEVEAGSDTVEVKQAKRLALAKDARNIQETADKAREAVDVARSLKDVNFQDAEARLTSAITIIEALQKYLEGK